MLSGSHDEGNRRWLDSVESSRNHHFETNKGKRGGFLGGGGRGEKEMEAEEGGGGGLMYFVATGTGSSSSHRC